MIIDQKYFMEEIDRMFPCRGPGGTQVQATTEAEATACKLLGLPVGTALQWHLPDVFSVRSGSGYVATALHGDKKIRFHSYLGSFKEGDDRACDT
jgi:hypothetical protein